MIKIQKVHICYHEKIYLLFKGIMMAYNKERIDDHRDNTFFQQF